MVRLVVVVVVLVFSLPLYAGVFKWVDDEGQVHFGDKPEDVAERVKVNKHPVSGTEHGARQNGDDAGSDEDANVDKETRETAAKLRDEYKEFCEKTRSRLAKLEQGGRIYEVDKHGGRTYLTEEGVNEKIVAARQDLKKHCED